ncbi:uncharacterized protein Triagg1_9645 [Trichoderma aggressivum f. europaeum]|uniref:Gem-associated protein 5 TPR domain-containing protein n=1 Tax=Trichoderma aggressivum f. europaeum TaxID=173218 RepID=A0AAE1M0M6_9HYPO|nr:hypothetical protein Triagg1_9645 [Trichoderma aggressivum f. europaeum]
MSSASHIHTVSNRSGKSSTARGRPAPPEFAQMPNIKDLRYFIPSAATAAIYLYAQGPSIVCCHHDTLTIDRRFTRHVDDVQLLAVDTQSEMGAGRFVVSYDAGQTAIVWDLMTGDEISRFVSYETLTVASWMRNGNVAFGNTQGNIILFEPTTSEHISARTLDQIAVTALAPSSDCRTFAIGYQNGSLLVATLQPRFTILHNLTTSRGPSPIVTLSWHASSSRQKSDMLAVQTHDGDLRVWSVAKSYNAEDPAKVIRVLQRNENILSGPNWMGWSKNGRIIQYSDSETFSWDVRTKHVTKDSIPTLEHVKGLAVYGPGASLFTIGPNNTVQQFDLNSPAIMVANVQHPAGVLPPSPPTSEETGGRSVHSATTIHTSESESSSVPLEMGISESDDDHLSPFQRLAKRNAPEVRNEVYDSGSQASSHSSLSKSSAGSRTPGQAGSLRSRGMTEGTYISAGSSLHTSTVGRREVDNYSMGYTLPSTSGPSLASSKSRHRPSRLRHEVPRSPDDAKVQDLFKYTRSRLSDLPYKHPIPASQTHPTNDDLRRQMLSTIFGWNKEVDDLIRDEMSRYPAGSANRILLAKWLGDIDSDIMAAGSQNMTSQDWMLLALSGIGGQASQHKLGRVYVQRLLENGDIHVAVTIMLGMGDYNDAIEVYISHKRYMEALILTCVAFPSVWERQAAIVRKWGEWSVKHGQQQLAIRCFACTDQESSEPWTSPSAAQLNFQNITPSIPEMLSPPLSPPGVQRGPQRSVAKASALKLITSFGDQNQKAKFYSQADGGQTPIAAGVTPIAESAISPGNGFDPATAFLRPLGNSRFNTPTSARPAQNFNRGRLSSIGEATLDRNSLKPIDNTAKIVDAPPQRAGHSRKSSATQDNMTTGLAMQRAATASPMMMRDQHPRVVQGYSGERPPSPDQTIMSRLQEVHSTQRNGSRDRIPSHLHLQLQPLAQPADAMSPDQSAASSNRFHWPSRTRRGTGPPVAGSVAGSITSTSSAGRSHKSNPRHRDDYIHSLEAAQSYSKRAGSRTRSKERTRDVSTGRHGSRERRAKSRDPSEERGRASARSWTKAKRSPTSPVPMSPEDLAILSTQTYNNNVEPLTIRKASVIRGKTSGRASSQGRSRSAPRSPPSPVPLSATALHYQGSEDEEDFRAAMQAQEEFRAKHSRSVGHNINSPVVGRREYAESRRRETPESREAVPTELSHTVHVRAASTEHAGDLKKMKDERQRKKEQAARELEERRKSLAKRQLGPQIPHPSEISPGMPPILVEAEDETLPDYLPPRSATEPPRSMYARNGPHIGLPATPKAMRLIVRSDDSQYEDLTPPPVPATFSQKYSPQSSPGYSPHYYMEKKKVVQREEEDQQQRQYQPPPPPPPPQQQQQQQQQQQEEEEPLTLLPSTVYQLPSTVYQPPSRPMIPRSMSAPIPEEPSRKTRFGRKGSANEGRGLDDIVETEWRRQVNNLVPPPPPPPPSAPATFLKELQHLAVPPPPPPPPLPHVRRQPPVAGTLASGMIEIVMDDTDTEDPMMAAPNDGMVPMIPPPEPPVKAHNRGRSLGEGSLSGRMAKTNERLRSGSRSRKEGSISIKSPPLEMYGDGGNPFSQLRSPVAGIPPPVLYDRDAIRSPIEGHGRKLSSAGLHGNGMF